MSKDIFICYDEQDEKVASDLCNYLENKDLSCWLKKRDLKEGDTVLKISEAIRQSKCFVLVYSENAKNSNFTVTELDIAFSSSIPIHVFKIDDAIIDGKIQFYLEDKPIIYVQEDYEAKHKQLFDNISQILGNSVETEVSQSNESNASNESNDVYICYTEEDNQVASAICHALEENNIRCWLKSRDLGINGNINDVMDVINKSRCMVLVFSENADKSAFVKTDIDIASSHGIPILSFNIDQNINSEDSSIESHWLDAFPNPEDKFRELIINTSKLLDKPIVDPKIDSHYNLKTIPKKTPPVEITPKKAKPVETTPKVEVNDEPPKPGIWDKINKKALIAIIAIILVVGAAGMFLMNNNSTLDGGDYVGSEDYSVDSSGSDDGMISLTSVHCDDDTDSGYSWKYSTFVWFVQGSSAPSNFDDYKITADYYDESDSVQYTSTEKIGDLKNEEIDQYLLSAFLDKYSPKVKLTIFDENGNEVYQDLIEGV